MDLLRRFRKPELPVRAGAAPSILHPERPLTGDELSRFDHGRLKGVIDALEARIDTFARQQRSAGHKTLEGPYVVGLFGGFGHGKTTALRAALTRSRAEFRLRMVDLDASLYHADALDEKLLRLLLWWPLARWLLRLPIFVVTAFVLAALGIWAVEWYSSGSIPSARFPLYFLLEIFGAAARVIDAIGLAALVGLMVATALGIAGSKLFSGLSSELSALGGWWDRVWYRLALRLQVAPQLVVIDDLDRARLDQQRAVLRALCKHARVLRCLVIVAMDERPLLAGPADPEAPEELLRKTVHAEYRMPERTCEDAALLSAQLCRDFVEQNHADQPGAHAWWPWIGSVRFVSDVARVLVLSGAISPRRAKRLLADLVSRAEVQPPEDLRDLSALLRLVGLQGLLPKLRDPEAVSPILENNVAEGFRPALEKLGLTGTLLDEAVRYLNGTRAQLPSDPRNWRRASGSDQPRKNNWGGSLAGQLIECGLLDVAQRPKPDSGLDNNRPAESRKFAIEVGDALRHAASGLGASGTHSLEDMARDWGSPPPSAITPLFVVVIATEPEPHRRLRIFETWGHYLGDEIDQGVRADCLREWLADSQVWRVLSREWKRTLVMGAASTRQTLELLAGIDPEESDFSLYIEGLKEARRSEASFTPVFARAWAATIPDPIEIRTFPTVVGTTVIGENLAQAVLPASWPPLETLLGRAHQSDRELTLVHALAAAGAAARRGMKELPRGFRTFARSERSREFSAEKWFGALHAYIVEEGNWDFSLSERWQADLPLPVEDALKRGADLSGSRWLTALCLAHVGNDADAVTRLLSTESGLGTSADLGWLSALIRDGNSTIWRTLSIDSLRKLGFSPDFVVKLSEDNRVRLRGSVTMYTGELANLILDALGLAGLAS